MSRLARPNRPKRDRFFHYANISISGFLVLVCRTSTTRSTMSASWRVMRSREMWGGTEMVC